MDECLISGDKDLLYQAWINLISNAVKYTDNGGKIKIYLKQNDNITVSISDNGIGMSQDEAEKVFQRFYKVDKARNSSGTGLGLSIVKKIVELHKGYIEMTSSIGNGTVFTVTLLK